MSDESERANELLTKYQQFERLGLERWERKAIEMRADGYTYGDIVAEVAKMGKGVKEETLRGYFYHAGKLKPALELWREIRGIEAMAEARLELKQAVKLAVITLLALMRTRQSGAVRLGAAKEVLDRNLGKSKQSMELSGEGFSRDAEKLEKIIGILTEGEGDERQQEQGERSGEGDR